MVLRQGQESSQVLLSSVHLLSPRNALRREYCNTSVCPSRFDLVNSIETKSLCAYSLNLVDMFIDDERMNLIDFRGQRSRSQLTYMEISL